MIVVVKPQTLASVASVWAKIVTFQQPLRIRALASGCLRSIPLFDTGFKNAQIDEDSHHLGTYMVGAETGLSPDVATNCIHSCRETDAKGRRI